MQGFVVSSFLRGGATRQLRNAAISGAPVRMARQFARPSSVRMMCSTSDSTVESVRMKLTEALKPLKLNIFPTYGDPNGSHVSIEVISEAFEGESVVTRHKMVYRAIWEEMQGAIHAVDSLVTKTPDEAGI